MSSDFTARVVVDASQVEQLIGILQEVNASLSQSGQSFQEYASQNQAAANAAQQTVTAIQSEVGPLGQLTSTFRNGVTGIQQFTTTEEQLGPAMQGTNSAIESGVGPLSQLGVGFQQAGTESQTFATNLTTMATETTPLNTELQTMNTTTSEMTGIFAGAGTEVQTMTGSLTGFSTEAQAVTGGLTEMNTVAGQTTTTTEQMGAAQDRTKGSTASLGQSIGTLASSFVAIGSSIFGVFTGLDRLEKAQLKADKANLLANKSTEAVQKAQQKYNEAVQKFGPNSAQAQAAARDLAQAKETDRINSEKAALATQDVTQAQVEFAISVAGTAATMGGTITSIQQSITELARHRQATKLAAVETFAASGAIRGMGAAAGVGAIGVGGLGASIAAIAGPIIAAIALIALIETNTFGMGDAFRLTTIAVAQGVDNMIASVLDFWNQIVGLLNNLNRFDTEVENIFISINNAIIDALNGALQVAANFVNAFQSAIATIYNFVVDQVINPIIGAWNRFLQGLETTAPATIAKIVGFFQGLGADIVGAMLTLVGGLNTAFSAVNIKTFEPAAKGLAKFQSDLKTAATTNQNAANQVRTDWQGGIPTLDKIPQQFNNVTVATVGTKDALKDTTAAGHVYDSLLQNIEPHLAANVSAIINWWSEGKNVSAMIKGNLTPALREAMSWITQHIQGGSKIISELFGVNKASASAGEGFKQEGQGAQVAAEAEKGLSEAIVKTAQSLGNTNTAFINQLKSLNLTKDGYDELAKMADTYIGSAVKINKAADDQKKFFGELWPTIGDTVETEAQLAIQNASLENSMGSANQQALRFNITFAEMRKKMNDATVQAEAEANATNLLTGSEEQLINVRAQSNKTLADANNKLQEYTFQLTDAETVTNRFQTAIANGNAEFEKFIIDTQDAGVKEEVFNKRLTDVVNQLGTFPSFMDPTIENYKKFVQANIQGGEAARQFQADAQKAWGDLVAASDDIFKKLVDVFDKDINAGPKKFKEAWKDVPKDIRRFITPDDKANVESSAKYAAIAEHAATLFALKLRAAGPQNAAAGAQLGAEAVTHYLNAISSHDPEMRAAFQPVFDALRTGSPQAVLAALEPIEKMGGTVGNIAGQMAGAFGGMNQSILGVGNSFGTASGGVDQFGNAVGSAQDPLQQLTNAMTGVGPAVDAGINQPVGGVPGAIGPPLTTAQGLVTTFAQSFALIGSIFQQVINVTIPAVLAALPPKIQGPLDAIVLIAAQAFANIGAEAQAQLATVQSVVNSVFSAVAGDIAGYSDTARSVVNSAFSAIAGDIAGHANSARNVVNSAFSAIRGNIAGYTSTARSNVNTNFAAISGNIAGHTNTARNVVNSGFRAIDSAIGSAMNSARSRVNSAMSAISSSIQSGVSRSVSAIHNLQNAINNLKGKTVQVNAVIGRNDVGRLQSSINSLRGKTVTVNVVRRVSTVAASPIATGPAASPIATTTIPAGIGTATEFPLVPAPAPIIAAAPRAIVAGGGSSTGGIGISRPAQPITIILKLPNGKELARVIRKDIFDDIGQF